MLSVSSIGRRGSRSRAAATAAVAASDKTQQTLPTEFFEWTGKAPVPGCTSIAHRVVPGELVAFPVRRSSSSNHSAATDNTVASASPAPAQPPQQLTQPTLLIQEGAVATSAKRVFNPLTDDLQLVGDDLSNSVYCAEVLESPDWALIKAHLLTFTDDPAGWLSLRMQQMFINYPGVKESVIRTALRVLMKTRFASLGSPPTLNPDVPVKRHFLNQAARELIVEMSRQQLQFGEESQAHDLMAIVWSSLALQPLRFNRPRETNSAAKAEKAAERARKAEKATAEKAENKKKRLDAKKEKEEAKAAAKVAREKKKEAEKKKKEKAQKKINTDKAAATAQVAERLRKMTKKGKANQAKATSPKAAGAPAQAAGKKKAPTQQAGKKIPVPPKAK